MRKARSEAPGSGSAVSACAPNRYARLVAAVAAFVALAVYLRTLAPTVTGEDAGELVAAAYTLGIPHPPGYPLWCILAHGFTWIPFGTIAWRVNLMSAAFAAGTVFLTAHLILLLTRNRLAALAGALALAFSREFWEQAVIAEVYSLNAFCIALCVLLLWCWHASRRDRMLYAFALAYGLSLGNHSTMFLLGPLFALFILAADRKPVRRWKTYTGLLLLAGVGSLVYLYLPIRSAANPPMDWGNPETWLNFWDVVRRKQFAFMFSQNPRSLPRFAHQLAVCFGFWTREFSPWVGAFGAFGLIVLLRRRLGYGLFLLALAFIVVVGAAYVQNFNFDKEWLWVMTVFGIPAYLVTAIGIGVALDALGAPFRREWGRGPSRTRIVQALAAGVAALVCMASPFLLHFHHNDRSQNYWAEDFATNVLSSLEADAIYIPESDHASFPALYLQTVEGLRPNVFIGRKCGYVDLQMLPDLPQDLRDKFGEFPRRRYEPEIFTWLLRHTGRPVYFEKPPRLPDAPEIVFKQAGLVYRALRVGENAPERDYWAWYHWRSQECADTRGDHAAQLILSSVFLAQAKERLHDGETEAGLALFEQALACYGRDPLLLNNIGVSCARARCYDAARRYFEEARALDPTRDAPARNLERLDKAIGTHRQTAS